MRKWVAILILLAGCEAAPAQYRPGSPLMFSRWWASKGGGFNLADYGTVYRWYDAADLEDGPVSYWPDKSANGYDVFQPSPTAQPTRSATNTFAAVYFDGTSDFLTNAPVQLNNLAYPSAYGIVCYKGTSSEQTLGFIDYSGTTPYFPSWMYNSFYARYFIGNISVLLGTVTNTNMIVSAVAYVTEAGANESCVLYINGQPIKTNTVSKYSSAKTTSAIGKFLDGGAYNKTPIIQLFILQSVTDIDGLNDSIKERYSIP